LVLQRAVDLKAIQHRHSNVKDPVASAPVFATNALLASPSSIPAMVLGHILFVVYDQDDRLCRFGRFRQLRKKVADPEWLVEKPSAPLSKALATRPSS
jgi:hypothetical protein